MSAPLDRFIACEALPGTGTSPAHFWAGVADIFKRFTPENRRLLRIRTELQEKIDGWWDQHHDRSPSVEAQIGFLEDIGYLVPEPAPFRIDPPGIDPEVARIAGPQLVVPVLNARFLLNAANARWGSLYDALYGTDALGSLPPPGGYDPARGAQVIAWVRGFLDQAIPLANGSWNDLQSGREPALRHPDQYVGRSANSRLYRHNGLHIEVAFDPDSPIGRDDCASISDVVLEAALTTIVDLEDSVAAVDADDKVAGYANWLGLIRGDLEASFEKDGQTHSRRLAPDRRYIGPDGTEFSLPGQSLLLVRNVGHLMETSAVRLPDGSNAPEGILDGILTSLIAMHDLKKLGRHENSLTGSIYIVKPKMHGPDEVAFTDRLFAAIENLLELPRFTLKVGIMDEERRTSANLAACIHEVRHRVFFINTGFLDRTGDEIRTATRAGAMVRKSDMKDSRWIRAYEDRNVQIGIASGFAGRAQIGKGMWAAPDRMADMLHQKIAHPQAGASTAWVPSPTAAVLHATHYHRVDVTARQAERAHEPVSGLDELLTPPLAAHPVWSDEEIRAEIDNSTQGVLGYVVRWIDQGIGCSKVPDINDVGLMEDRATLRISSQHLSNWLLHGVISIADIDAALTRMATRVDRQNRHDPAYRCMLGEQHASLAFTAARALIVQGISAPNGYTEPVLHTFRLLAKSQPSG